MRAVPHGTSPSFTPLAVSTKAGFGVGQVAGQLFRDVPSLLLLFYLTSVMGMAPALAGATIFVPKVAFGILFDLWIGLSSDWIAARFARRHWLLVGAIAAPLAMLGVFAVPHVAFAWQVVWVFVTFSFYMAVFSTFSVPYLAEFAEMSSDPAERTELMAWKHGFTGFGVLLGSSVAPVMIGAWGSGRAAYLTTTAVIGAICMTCLLTAWHYAGRIAPSAEAGRPLVLRDLPRAFTDRRFAVLCLAALIMAASSGVSYASFAFFVRYAMERVDAFTQIGILSAVMAVAVMVGSPFWVFVAARIGKKNTFVCAAAGHGLVTIVWGLCAHAPLPAAYGLAVLLAIFNAGWGLIVLSMLSDTIAVARRDLGENRAGAYSAIWSIIDKAGIALGGTLLAGGILSLSGFDAGVAKHGGPQSAPAIAGIVFAYAVVPGVAKLIVAALVWFTVESDDVTIASTDRIHAA